MVITLFSDTWLGKVNSVSNLVPRVRGTCAQVCVSLWLLLVVTIIVKCGNTRVLALFRTFFRHRVSNTLPCIPASGGRVAGERAFNPHDCL